MPFVTSQMPSPLPPPAPSVRPVTDLMNGLLLLAAILFVYSPTLPFEFVYDDHYYIVNNRHMADGLTLANIKWSFTKYYFSNWHPLTSLSYFLDTSLYGKVPWGYRLTNILLHIVNTWLVFLVGRELTHRNGLAWWMAAVFALHPLHLESVVWISERKDVLSVLFGLWGILAYFKYARSPSARQYVLVCVLLIFSLLSKQTLITFPFLLLLFDAWPLGRLRLNEPKWFPRLYRLAFEKLPLLALSVFFGIAAVNAQREGESITSGVSPSIRAINAVDAVSTYLRQSVWPTDLCAYYPHPFHRARADAWIIASALLLAIVCVLALTALFGKKNESKAYVATGWFWFLGTLTPMLGIIQLGSAAHADRYMYFPQIGLSLLVGMFACRVFDAAAPMVKRFMLLVAYGSVAAFTLVAGHQAAYWQSNVTLFRHALSITRDNSPSRTNLADGLINEAELLLGRQPERARELLLEAEQHARAALRMRESDTAYHNLMKSLRLQGRLQEAIEIGLAAVEKITDSELLWFSLGWVFHDAGDASRAADCYARAIENFPNYVEAYNRLAMLISTIDPVRSAELCRTALSIDPRHVEARVNLGNALVRQGRFEEALSEYQHALRLDPGNDDIRENIKIAERLQRAR